jgi:hypothetical protein
MGHVRKRSRAVAVPTTGAPSNEKKEPNNADIEIGGRLAESATSNDDGPVGGRLRYPDENVTLGGRLGTFPLMHDK